LVLVLNLTMFYVLINFFSIFLDYWIKVDTDK